MIADSDEESERRRNRDKFRRERTDYDSRRRPGDKREPFDDRVGSTTSYSRNENRSVNTQPQVTDRGRSSERTEPPYKRIKRDYDDARGSTGRRRDNRAVGPLEDESLFRPPLIPFKRFLEPLEDLITEQEACNKYRDYKDNYLKRHVEEFFEAHKNEEWLRLRYHPDYMDKRKLLATEVVKHRLEVFMDLLAKGMLDNQVVQMDNSDNLIKLMDSVVIKLEGGTDEDLNVLEHSDRNIYSDSENRRQRSVSLSNQVSNPVGSGHKSEEGEAESDLDAEDSDKGGDALSKVSKEPLSVHASPQAISSNVTNVSRARSSSVGSVHSDSSRSCSIASADGEREVHGDREDDQSSNESEVVDSSTHPAKRRSPAHMTAHSPLDDLEPEDDDVPTPTTAEAPAGTTTPNEAATTGGHSKTVTPTLDKKPSGQSVVTSPLKKSTSSWPLHKTASIFFRALPPSVSEDELRELCSSQPGFLRLALWEPVPERRFMRHAWATYKPTVNIKKVCWALNTSPLLREKFVLPNGDLGATVNRDLAQRVRPLTPLTRHKPVMRQDLLLAAQLVAQLDSRHNLWTVALSEGKEQLENSQSVAVTSNEFSSSNNTAQSVSSPLTLALQSKNPLLKNLTDYLVEEGGSEEEALIEAVQNDTEETEEGTTSSKSRQVVLESDPILANTLDRLILYLRIVHSMDFYAAATYPMEDQMPHRCGILHARGDRGLHPAVPGGRSSGLVFNQREVDDHLKNFAQRLHSLIDVPKDLSEDELNKLGLRDLEKAVEDFIEANIQKRTSKKKPFKVVWVCPLSDKKFREPIFVRKHIFNKHMEKVEAAKKDNAIFFNNYLRDPRRPCLPEAPAHMINQYYPSSGPGNSSGSYRGSYRNRMGNTSGYRGNYRNNNTSGHNALLPTTTSSYGRGGSFQDYYELAAQQQHQQQAMAAVAAAAAAALYPNATAADLYALAAAGSGTGGSGSRGGGRRGPPRGTSPNQDRSHYNDNRRRHQTGGYGSGHRRPYRSGERGMISYNDLDDPSLDGPR